MKTKVFIYIGNICFTLMFIVCFVIASNYENVEDAKILYMFSVILCCISFGSYIIYFVSTKEERKHRREEKRKNKDILNKTIKENMRLKKEKERITKEINNRPIVAKLMFTNDTYSGGSLTASCLGFACLSSPLSIPLLIAGMPKKTHKATFSVIYASGRNGIETVDINSDRFKELAKLTMD